MEINWQIVYTLIIITGIFFILGTPLKWRFQQIPFYFLPAFGMVVFGGIITAILYLIGNYHPYILNVTVILLLIFGAITLVLTLKKFRLTYPTLFSVIVSSLFVLIVAGYIIQASQFAVPGGIDPAIHTAYISHIVQHNDFNVSYPLGLHLLILFIENITRCTTPIILLTLQIFFAINIYILTYYIVKLITKNKFASIIGILAVILDTSIYNNYLNGSLTHLLGVLLILIGIILTIVLPTQRKVLHFVVVSTFYASVLYLHFVTLFMAIPVLWYLRIYRQKKSSRIFILSFLVSLLVAMPLLVKLFNVPGFRFQFLIACLIFLLTEILVLLFNDHIKKIFSNYIFLLIISTLGLLIFFTSFTVFDVIPEWYGLIILSLATIGTIFILVKKMNRWYAMVVYFSSLSILYYAIHLLSSEVDDIFKLLIFYYGFTLPLILLGAVGIYSIFKLIPGKKIKGGVLAFLLILVTLVSGSRSFDKIFIIDSRAISRYGQNSGFGIFYNRDDVVVAEWAKKNLPKNAGIVNPGGLYNSWASISQRKILYPAYAIVNSVEPEKTHQDVVDLLNNSDIECPQALIREGYEYLLMPTQYVLYIRSSCLALIYESGNSRLYKISTESTSLKETETINLSDLSQNKDISISGDYSTSCLYCDNRFYYQFMDIGKSLIIPKNKKLNVTVYAPDNDRNINLIVDGQNPLLIARIINKNEGNLTYNKEYVLQNYPQKKGEKIILQLENKNISSVYIRTITLEIN